MGIRRGCLKLLEVIAFKYSTQGFNKYFVNKVFMVDIVETLNNFVYSLLNMMTLIFLIFFIESI